MHETLSENNSKDVSESERNIVNETLSQNNSMDVSEYIITELKDELPVTEKVTSYFNIYECGRNLLDRLDVTYQRAFMVTPKYKYCNTFLDTLVKDNNLRGEPFSNQNIQDAVSDVIEETEAKFERNHNEITCDNSYQSPILKKDILTINDLVYYESDEHVDTISDSSKQVDASKELIKETHIVNRVRNLSVRVVSIEPVVIGVGIIGQDITQGVNNGGMSIGRNDSD